MVIRWKNTETAEGLIRTAGRETKKNIDLLNSGRFFSKTFVNDKPFLAMATTDYVATVKTLRNIEGDGWLREFKQYSKNLIQAFDFSDNSFLEEAYALGEKCSTYRILEAAFNAALFKEEGLQRRFKIIYNISKNIIKFNNDEYFLYAVPYIYYVNTRTGRILRCTKKIENFESFGSSGIDVWYNSNFDTIYEDGMLLGKWVEATYHKRSGGKSGTVYKYITFSNQAYLNEYGGKTFSMPAHQVVMLCYYDFSILKHCIFAGSLLVVHHIDENSENNSLMNLALTTRVGNAKEGKGSIEEPVNFLELFEILQMATTPYEYHKKYFK